MLPFPINSSKRGPWRSTFSIFDCPQPHATHLFWSTKSVISVKAEFRPPRFVCSNGSRSPSRYSFSIIAAKENPPVNRSRRRHSNKAPGLVASQGGWQVWSKRRSGRRDVMHILCKLGHTSWCVCECVCARDDLRVSVVRQVGGGGGGGGALGGRRVTVPATGLVSGSSPAFAFRFLGVLHAPLSGQPATTSAAFSSVGCLTC